MVLEWLPEDLQQVLTRAGGRLPEPVCAQVIQQLAEGLAALHVRGFVHRDLKPANVLLVRQEPGLMQVKLADLGLAKRIPLEGQAPSALPVSTAGSALLGTWEYMAPEQWVSSKCVDFKVDVYALGVLWFQMLAGRVPFRGEEPGNLMYRHVADSPPLHLLQEVASEATRAMVARMLEKTAAKRPTLEEVLGLVSAAGG